MLDLLKKYSLLLCLSISLLYGFFLFDYSDNFLKKILIAALILTNLINLPNKHTLIVFTKFILPWLPWIIGCLLVPILAHGSKGLTYQLHLLLIVSLLVFALSRVRVNRNLVILSLIISTLIISLGICVDISFNGLQTNVLGTNKNIVIGGLCVMSSILIMFLLTHKDPLSKWFSIILLLSVGLSVLAVILTEVRTALIGYCGLFFTIYFSSKHRVSPKKVSILVVGVLLLFICFWITGRLQEGIHDLIEWKNGNPDSSWGIRIELWTLALNAIPEHFMFGWGYQPFSQFLQHGYTFSVSSFPAQHLHNDYISYFATYGLIGLLGWIGTLILLARQAVNDPLRLAMIAVMACMGLTECMWSFTHFVLYVFFITWTLLWLSVNPIKDKIDILK